jgi:hypothetical protein
MPLAKMRWTDPSLTFGGNDVPMALAWQLFFLRMYRVRGDKLYDAKYKKLTFNNLKGGNSKEIKDKKDFANTVGVLD